MKIDVVRIGVMLGSGPMGYVTEGGESLGYDIEFVRRLVFSLNRKVGLLGMDSDAILTATSVFALARLGALVDPREKGRS